MKKKVNIFGKSVPVFVLVLLGIGLVSAALVGYISNEVSGTFNVDHPLLLEISVTDWDWVSTPEPIALGNIHGGEDTTFWLQVTNNADIDVDPVDLSVVLGSDYGDDLQATCEDFTWVKIRAYRMLDSESIFTEQLPAIEGNLNSLGCTVVDGKITLLLDSQYIAGEIEKYEIELTAALDIAPSTYTMTAQEMLT